MSSSSKSARFDYQLRIQVPINHSDAILLAFLKSDRYRIYSHREMVLSSLRPYWLPIALEATREEGKEVSDEELARIAFQAILHLRERAEMLHQRFCSRLTRERQKALEQSLRNAHQSSPDPSLLTDQAYFHQRNGDDRANPRSR